MADNLSPEQRRRTMAAVKSKDTLPERIVRSLAHNLGYRFRLHRRDLPGKPDLVFPRYRKVIFVHGCFWHQHHCRRGNRLPKCRASYWHTKLRGNVRRDQRHRRRLNRQGWSTMVIWECQINAGTPENLASRIRRFLG